MQTLFITIFDGAISKNILRTEVLRSLTDVYRIILFVPAKKKEYYAQQFKAENVIIEETPQPDRPTFESRFQTLALDCFHTNTVRIKISNNYLRTHNVAKFLIKLFLWQLGRFQITHRILRAVYVTVPDYSFDHYFEKYRPDAVFVPNMMSNEDYRLIKAARRRGVISIGMPKSWDNFTSKTFFNTFPDWIMVQNEHMKKEAQQLFGYPASRLVVVGFPQFDVYEDSRLLESRDSFLRNVGLDPQKKTILYAAAGHQLAPFDEEVLTTLIENVESDPSLRNMQILVRPHPKYEFKEEIIPKKPFVVIDYPGVVEGTKQSHWEFRDSDIKHLVNSLYHMDILVSTVSTLNLEGAIFDKPLISIGFDGNQKMPFAMSTARYYRYDHMLPVVESGGMAIAYNAEELKMNIRKYIDDPSRDSDGRRRIVKNLVGCYGKAGKKVTQFITEKIPA